MALRDKDLVRKILAYPAGQGPSGLNVQEVVLKQGVTGPAALNQNVAINPHAPPLPPEAVEAIKKTEEESKG